MLKLIKEVLRVGDATLPYPFAPMEHDAGISRQAGARPGAVHRLRGLRDRLPVQCAVDGDRS